MSGAGNSSALLRAATDSGMIRRPTEDEIVEEARRSRRDPLDVATARLRVPREAFYRALAQARRLTFVEPAELVPDAAVLSRVPPRLLLRKDVLPLRLIGDAVLVVTADPDDAATLETLRRVLDAPLSLALAEPSAIQAAVRRHVRAPAGEAAPAWDAVSFLDDLLRQAWLHRASDVHLDPQESGLHLRLRVDGRLIAAGPPLGNEEAQQLLSRVKVLGGLDIAERREPQDGGFSHRHEDQSFDVRLATIPTRYGERATLRLLGVETRELTLDRLGFEPADLARLRQALDEPHGMFLLTGPTGAGKTTTLYAALREVATPELNIMTVEDPVEFLIPGITQIGVDRAGKVTFARALRSLLRHDPDIVMVGEIRDDETADVAIKAAMTGHLVLASLHANRAAGAPARLIDLGCEPFLVSATLRAAIAQRLVRRLCECRVARPATVAELARIVGLEAARPHDGVPVFDPGGCPGCLGTGYRGRLSIVEALWVDEAISAAIARGVPAAEVAALARGNGAATLAEDALRKVLDGSTSVAEAFGARA
jgi:type IV pilus assembly protein PilB